MKLGLLPWSLLVSSLAWVATAAPIDLQVLTPDNFKDTIASGVWLIEHFSPYCGHCRAFAPTWSRLVEDAQTSEDPGIQLAQVNCAVNGDLCTENKVDGYPQMNLYRNGDYVETFKGSRDYERLAEFISRHAEPTGKLARPTSTGTATVEAPTQTGAPLHIQTPRVKANQAGTVLSLTPNSFQDVVGEGPVFVKFYAPWCGHCKKLAPIWTQLARKMQNKLNIAEVNCDDHGSLCKAQGILGYPMLQFYSNGVKSEYTGGRKIEQLQSFAEKASAPSVQELVVSELEKHTNENNVVYLLLHSDSRILNQVTQASQVLLGSPPVYTSSSPELFSRFSIPDGSWALLALKDHDAKTPAASYPIDASFSGDLHVSLSKWLLHNRLPTIAELTQENFQEVMNAPQKPLVVIVAVTQDDKAATAKLFKEIGVKWKIRKGGDMARSVVFTYMDAERWAKWLKGMYGVQSDHLPSIVIADHGSLLYYDQDTSGNKIKLSATSLFSTIDGISQGTVKAKSSESFVERMARHLNSGMTSLENQILDHPLRFAFFVLIFLGLVFMGLKKLIQDDVSAEVRSHRQLTGHQRKANRLD